VNGAVNAKAQGQATISTAVNTLKAIFASKINSQTAKAINNKIGVK
jgi:hypothetical protein